MKHRILNVLITFVLLVSLSIFPSTAQAFSVNTETDYAKLTSEIVVNNVDELIANIKSDTVIKLEAGEYDLGETEDSANPNVGYVSDHLDDSSMNPNGAIISNISNLKIYADEGADVLLYSTTADDNVLILDNCDGITFENITLGHKVPPADVCSAGVFYLIRTTDSLFKQCDIYGCGTQGFFIELCSQIAVDNSYIHDCTYSAADARDSEDLSFTDCEISGIANTYGSVFCFEDTVDNVTINGCTINNNGNSAESHNDMFSIDNPDSILLVDCSVWNNYFTGVGRDCCLISFDTNGGGDEPNKMTDFHTKISAPVTPEKPGYSFAGWYTDSEMKNKWDFDTNTVTANMTLHAKWTTPVAITASVNNAAYGVVSGSGTYNTDTSVTLTATPNNGYRFVHWLQDGVQVSVSANYNFTATAARSLTAVFAPLTPVSLICSKNDAMVYNGTDGSITVMASGGDSSIYEYSINEGASWQTSNFFGGLIAGTYTAAVRDATYTSNTATCSVSVGQPAHKGTVPANKISAKVNAGTALTVTPPAPPKGYTVQSVAYSSSNPSVAMVDANGNVTFLTGGKVTIITKIVSQMVDKKGKIKTKTTTVKKTITIQQPVAAIGLNLYDTTIERKQKVQLSASFDPVTATNKKVKWKSSNPKVASVSGKGLVVGKAGGTAVITCSATDGSGVIASCTVNVTPIYPVGLKLSKAALTIKVGKGAGLRATVLPKTTDFKTVTWTSSDPGIVTVDAKGRIRGITPGTAVITATTSNGIAVSCTVTVP